MNESEIWLRDLALCLHEFEPEDDATARAIARAVGLGGEEPQEGEELPAHLFPAPVRSGEGQQVRLATPGEPPADVDLDALPVLPQVTDGDTAASIAWSAAEQLESEPPAGARPAPRHEPLLEPGWTRQLLASALATTRHDGPVDGVQFVDTVARGAVVDDVPRLPRASLSRGAQLLVDVGDAMDPFVLDRRELVSDVVHVIGTSRISTLFFRDAPTRGAGAGPVWTWKRYAPPEPGVPVLAVTDLGIGGARASYTSCSDAEWIALADLLRPRDSRLIALVPYPERRWPRRLARELTIVQWDRSTTASRVHTVVARTQR